MKQLLYAVLLALVVAVGCQTTPQGINQTSQVKPGTPIWEFETGNLVFSSPAIGSDGTEANLPYGRLDQEWREA